MHSWVYARLESLGLMRPATRRFFDESACLLDALHGWVYARYTHPYVKFLLSRASGRSKAGSRWLADRYHAKVLTADNARSIVVNERVIRRGLDRVVPFPTAREIVLKGPPAIAAYECACRQARPAPCQPTRVCMILGQPFVDMVLG